MTLDQEGQNDANILEKLKPYWLVQIEQCKMSKKTWRINFKRPTWDNFLRHHSNHIFSGKKGYFYMRTLPNFNTIGKILDLHNTYCAIRTHFFSLWSESIESLASRVMNLQWEH